MLHTTRRVLSALLGIVVVIVLLVFFTVLSQQNPTLIPLHWFEQVLGRFTLSNWLALAFVGGGVFGLLSAALTLVKLKLNNAALLRKLHRRNRELQRLRTQVFKGIAK